MWGAYQANYGALGPVPKPPATRAPDHTIDTALIEACEDGVGMGTAVSGGMFLATEVVAMPASPEERAARYRNFAAFLRQLAARTRADTAGAQLPPLADEFDRLAVSIGRATFAA